METNNIYTSQLTSKELEASFSTLRDKLKMLKETLSDEEGEVFSKIIKSAGTHLSSLQQSNQAEDKFSYIKPISAAASVKVREDIIALSDELEVH
ncbi:Uncharacterised protein [Serratia quinivorans]|uniref:Uncharacterized protein n=1 Tax=Serratia quinivorans TaxID=137545 RepID=A0A380AF13_9GAMM|nr:MULTISPECIES: hypothetical protein [Serratia]MCS4267935.1 hypothetical protein [Serratia sp. BIGb0163]QBX69030.1 hypothetical protein E4343_23970 [Serratia quinivorans]RYM64561.1 hypothetical protein BSR03_03325 [Serratia proteamaculans]CAI0704578.1 Uncharacterised protein [Serratia quinivorans]CAI0741530.1 Uncharacterised protein [Serratia quinivorans]